MLVVGALYGEFVVSGQVDLCHEGKPIRWNPDRGWLEIKLPAPLARLANRPHGRYRLSCPVAFAYRGDEVSAQAATGAVRYDITLDAGSGRWYLDASWRTPAAPAPSLDELRQAPVVAVARALGRERSGNRPSRGARGRAYRRAISGIPTGKFRDRLTQMTHNAGLAVIAVDPAYTSRWGAEHWLAPLRAHHPQASGHHAAAAVIGRRALGHRARRRAGVTGTGQRTSRRRAAPRAPAAGQTDRNGRPRQAERQPPTWHKTATATRLPPPDQAAHDRSGPPAEQHKLPLSD